MLTGIKHAVQDQLSPRLRKRLRELLVALRLYPEEAAGLARLLEMAEGKIRQVGGTVDRDHIDVAGIRLKNCYRYFVTVVAQILYHQQYKLSLSGRWIAVDIGANAGVASLFFAQHEPVTRIYAFEPLVPTYRMLEDNLRLNPMLAEKIEAFNLGLGDKDENVTIPYDEARAMSASSMGVYNRFLEHTDSLEHIALRDSVVAMRDIFSRHPEEKVLLKVDCEGAEFEILPHLSRHKLLDRVHVIMMEFHDKDPDDLTALLEREGFISFTEWARRDLNIGMIRAVRCHGR